MKIYVVGSSKNKFLPLDNIREKFLIDQPHEGDNIDFLNPWYCELTGLYYLWKHVDDDIVGLEHYRRYFVNRKNKLLSEGEIREALKTNDILYIKNINNYNSPLKILDKHSTNECNKSLEILKFLSFIKLYKGENYYNVYLNHLNSNWYALGNMFVCKKEIISEYCEFIFDIFKTYIEAEKYYNRKIPPRMIGYFAEFLFGAWIQYKKLKAKNSKVHCFMSFK